MLGFILKLFGGDIISKVIGAIPSLFGNREKREEKAADFDSEVVKSFAAENMQVRENRNWFDSLVDGLNRLPRPVGFAAVCALMIWPVYDVIGFSAAMQAYELVPAWIAGLVITVVTFYYGGRLLVKDFGLSGPSKKKVEEVLAAQRSIRELDQSYKDSAASRDIPQQLPSRSSEKPLTLDAIKAWNKKNNPTYKP